MSTTERWQVCNKKSIEQATTHIRQNISTLLHEENLFDMLGVNAIAWKKDITDFLWQLEHRMHERIEKKIPVKIEAV